MRPSSEAMMLEWKPTNRQNNDYETKKEKNIEVQQIINRNDTFPSHTVVLVIHVLPKMMELFSRHFLSRFAAKHFMLI